MFNMTNLLYDAVSRAHALCFDLFHTLTDINETSPGGKNTWELFGVSKDAWHAQVLDNSPWRLTGIVKDPVEIIGRMARAIHPDISDDLVRGVAEYRYGRFDRAVLSPPERSLDALRGLKRMGKKIALVSNADAAEVRSWNQSPFAPFFDYAVFSCDVGCMKPDARIFLKALERLGEKPEHCIFVGDGGADELRAARGLGFTTVMVTGYLNIAPEKMQEREAHADYVIRHVDELVSFP